MTWPEALLRHAALALSVTAIGAAGLRLAANAGARGLQRIVAATVLAAAAATGEALLLGLVGLGTNVVGLVLAAVGTWGLAQKVLPPVGAPVLGELRTAVLAYGPLQRSGIGAATGIALVWSLWLLRYPALGHDMLLYHLPEAINWVHNGHPGSIEPVVTGIPVGAYPLTHEVLLAWGLGITHSFVPATLLTALMPALVALAAWAGLRELGVPRVAAGMAAGALVATPAVLASQSGGASLDPAALGWLTSCGCLAAGARRRPGLLPIALVAAGLAAGTKTTAIPLAAVAVTLAVWPLHRRLRALAWPLVAAGIAVLLIGGFWYVRDLLMHGSPLWPYAPAPWGDAAPPVIAAADVSFLDRPGETLSRLGGYYVRHFGGPLVLLAGAAVMAVLVRRREVVAAALAALLSVVLWTAAPLTGVVGSRLFDAGTGDATRYLLPGAAAAALAVALAARNGGAARVVSTGLLSLAVAVGLLNTFGLGFPQAPSPLVPLAGGAVGAVLGVVALAAARIAPRLRSAGTRSALATVVMFSGVAGATASDGYVARHATTGTRDGDVVRWLDSQKTWSDGAQPVATTFSLIAPLAGDRLRHPLTLLGPSASCTTVRRARASGWVVLDRPAAALDAPGRCLRDVPAAYADAHYLAYRPGAP